MYIHILSQLSILDVIHGNSMPSYLENVHPVSYLHHREYHRKTSHSTLPTLLSNQDLLALFNSLASAAVLTAVIASISAGRSCTCTCSCPCGKVS